MKMPIFILLLFLTSLVIFRSKTLQPTDYVQGYAQVGQGPLVDRNATLLANSVKIPIAPARWYQLNNVANGLEGLFDGKTDEKVQTGYGKVLRNFDAYYPLEQGEEVTIDGIRFYDGEGTNTDAIVTLSIVNDRWERITVATFTGSEYNQWVGPNPNKLNSFTLEKPVSGARYLVLNTSGIYPNEMELYGTYKAGTPAVLAPLKSATLEQQMGVNAFEWDFAQLTNHAKLDEARVKAAKNFTAIRHYLDWEKLEYLQGAYTFNTTMSGGWNYDAMYERCKLEGIEVLACLKTIPGWVQNSYPPNLRDSENAPLLHGKDISNPASYGEQAKAAFQFAARYGRNKQLSADIVSVFSAPKPQPYWSNSNEKKIGLGLITYMECDNERDKWWKGRKAYQTAREYAANLSAFYDGHKNTMGPGVGVKNADPTMQVVIGGLASPSTDYVRGMIDWCKEFRGYNADGTVNLCWDVINQHLYATDAQQSQGGSPTRGAAPEKSGIMKYAEDFVKMSRQYAYGMPVWITEVGYDVNPGSVNKAIAVGKKTVLETQADWTLRTALMFARAGIDRTFFYQLYDDDINSTTKFQSMGLMNPNYTRKPAADYLQQVNRLLGKYTYKETISQDPLVDRYELDGKSAYALMVPDEKGRTADYVLNLGTAAGAALVYSPTIGSDSMTLLKVNPIEGKLKLTVTETPIFIVGTEKTIRASGLQQLQIFPNPSLDYFNIALNNDQTTDLDINIYDLLGRLQYHKRIAKTSAQLTEKISVSSLPYGAYVVEVNQGADRVVRKILKTRQ
ncbi:T9SS type A sorting domain-containing protein [Spirosoma aerophilum]